MGLAFFAQDEQFTLEPGIRVIASGDPASPVLSRFFAGYDRAFILPDEREELQGFKDCLILNPTFRHAFGRTHCELVMVLEDEDGNLLSGANFLATSMPQGLGPVSATIALNYVYVEEAARGRGLLKQTLCAVRRLAAQALGLDPSGPPLPIFIEQNDPLRLTEAEYALDTSHSGLDQIDRLAIWSRRGARLVDIAYVQPPLSGEQQVDDGLVYAVLDYPVPSIDPRLLHDHLESFFRISVLKGKSEPKGGAATKQLAALLARRDPVALLDMAPALAWLRSGRSTEGFESLPELAREAQR